MNIVANILLEERNEPPPLLAGWGAANPFCETPSHAGPHKQRNTHSRPASQRCRDTVFVSEYVCCAATGFLRVSLRGLTL